MKSKELELMRQRMETEIYKYTSQLSRSELTAKMNAVDELVEKGVSYKDAFAQIGIDELAVAHQRFFHG